MSAELRRTLRELTDVPPPADLATNSIRLAGRRRRNRIVAGAAALLVAVVVAVPLALRPDGRGEPVPIGPTPSITSPAPELETPEPTPAPDVPLPPGEGKRRVVAFAYAGALPTTSTDNEPITPDDAVSYVLDRTTGEYRKIDYRVVAPAPDGKRFFVADGGRGGFMAGAGGPVQWVDHQGGFIKQVDWSPDGRRVLLNHDGGFTVVDATTRAAGSFVPMADASTGNARGLGFFWVDGRTLGHTVSVANGEANPDRTVAIRFYDLRGKKLRTLGFPGTTAVRTSADVSPDGRRAAAIGPWDERRIEIVDLATGEVEARLSGDDVAGWYDDDHLVLKDDSGLQVVDLTGRVVRSLPGSDEVLHGSTVHLVPAAGLPAKSARYAF
ncbi:hypothetical protein Ais01nite_29890 [Asanoa ishikariensis]|uniref:WD40-like Beta Propeller Repeat n=1 Tax=Asanoa ishikariensis TaxID=137265 RepID=A0A1H3QJW5_9ACTN|nr:WD40 repeat domain-containing protein [Asanoa ishikariensis]GIF64954.1 hypothetical protein Ais01nite_29890 [Asanoa ishikariensis]SDZ13647.1 hypothetical protein SAMN05421684_2933 [Asanoa ishikariensis]